MFWKIAEFLVRIIFRKRFKQAALIGKAVEAAGDGNQPEALDQLAKIEPKLHPSLTSIFHLTKGRILVTADRFEEAERSFNNALTADPTNPKIKLDLAMVTARQFRFDYARKILLEVKAIPVDPDVPEEFEKERQSADDLLAQLDKVESGALESEYKERATNFSIKPLLSDGQSPGLPANLELLDTWITNDKEQARDSADEIALLLGYTALMERGTTARVGISIEDFAVLKSGTTILQPFDMIAKRFDSEDSKLAELLA